MIYKKRLKVREAGRREESREEEKEVAQQTFNTKTSIKTETVV